MWLVYENLNSLNNKMAGNDKLNKAKGFIDNLELDLVCLCEHRQNLMNRDNQNGFLQLFQGREAEIRSVVANNMHEGREAGRVQEGGRATMVLGQQIEQFDFKASGRHESGLGWWVVLVFHGSNGIVT